MLNRNMNLQIDPYEHNSFVSLGGWDYVIGSIFFVLAIVSISFHTKFKRDIQRYKDKQLEEYKKDNNRNNITYQQAGLYLPWSKQMKAFAPIFFFLLFTLIGIAFMVGHPISYI